MDELKCPNPCCYLASTKWITNPNVLKGCQKHCKERWLQCVRCGQKFPASKAKRITTYVPFMGFNPPQNRS